MLTGVDLCMAHRITCLIPFPRVEETTQGQHFCKYSLLDIILLQHVNSAISSLNVCVRKVLKRPATQNLYLQPDNKYRYIITGNNRTGV